MPKVEVCLRWRCAYGRGLARVRCANSASGEVANGERRASGDVCHAMVMCAKCGDVPRGEVCLG